MLPCSFCNFEVWRRLTDSAPTRLSERVSSCSIVGADSHPGGATCVPSKIFLLLAPLNSAQFVCCLVIMFALSSLIAAKYLFCN
jgi:hypothetical protein